MKKLLLGGALGIALCSSAVAQNRGFPQPNATQGVTAAAVGTTGATTATIPAVQGSESGYRCGIWSGWVRRQYYGRRLGLLLVIFAGVARQRRELVGALFSSSHRPRRTTSPQP